MVLRREVLLPLCRGTSAWRRKMILSPNYWFWDVNEGVFGVAIGMRGALKGLKGFILGEKEGKTVFVG
jgi:hypothetical protein